MSQDQDRVGSEFGSAPTYRLALTTLAATILLIVVGGFTRGSGSGYGCADRWPLCENGLAGGWLPRADYHMIIEWSHRWLAATVGLLAAATVVSAWRHHRHNRSVAVSATGALAVIFFQAWIGRAVVREQLDADLVSLHLAISLTVAALLVIVVVRLRIPKPADRPADRRWLTLLILGAGGVFTVIMLGSLVHNLYFPGWPLMSDLVIPELGSRPAVLHFLHRLLSVLYAVAAMALWTMAKRKRRPRREVILLETAALLYVTNVLVGGAHVFTEVSSAVLVAVHLGLASTIWALTVAAAVSATSARFPAVRRGRLAERS